MNPKASPRSSWDFRRGVATARVLTQLGFDHGVSVDAMLRHTGITRAILDDPKGEIEAHQEIQLIRNLQAERPHVPTLGLQAGTRYHVTTYGLWGYAVLASPTLGAAVSMASRMLNQTFSLTTNEVEQVGDQVMVTYHSDHLPLDVRQFIVDRDRASVMTLQREILGHPLPYQAIYLRRPEPAQEMVEAYTSLFGVRPLFGQAHDRSVFAAALMQQPLPQADAHTAQLCEQMCKRLVERRSSRTGVAGAVRDRLLRTPGHIPDMEEVAAEMGMTSRTLRRHLTAEGASFRGLLEEVRSTLAEELMASASLTHGEIAERLGYADVTTFIEAFRRWRGVPPSEFRRLRGLPGQAPRRRFIPR
ncbi:helix-turn-helix domain-containing protein [Aquabacterium fontiphilum]|uniref:AraC family transcriptional regulator n=1 Tax=Aquabacterium fontiphilum TaxID=450365 RepID=UPI001378686E|nr:AraC family transcriptional regulator [Aquabacterium fontiphilum]NBD19148.1 helix-turn-helix domain-containing protein [Aquabacterium fontiphilum]